MGNDTCVFCKMVSGEIPAAKVYEDKSLLAFLDIGPLSDGHTLLIPKEHFETLDQCPSDLLGRIASVTGKIAKAVIIAVNADGYNILVNNGRAAGQLVQHLHFHIIARREGDGLFSQWPAGKYPEGKIEELTDKIRGNI